MVKRILEPVRAGLTVCAAFYGHPGVFAFPSHVSICAARAASYFARMLRGDFGRGLLSADLGLDPSMSGYQSFAETHFLITTGCSTRFLPGRLAGRRHRHLTSARRYDSAGLAVLTERLLPSTLLAP